MKSLKRVESARCLLTGGLHGDPDQEGTSGLIPDTGGRGRVFTVTVVTIHMEDIATSAGLTTEDRFINDLWPGYIC